MQPVIHAYKLRLTNLSQSNRSLKLGILSPRKDLDLTTAGFINKLSSEEILTRIVAGKSVDLVKALNARDEATNLLDLRLNKIYHEVTTILEETGAEDLFVGYPFVEGKFLDGSVARCPVVLFPVRLERDFEGGTRWKLRIPEDGSVVLNKTFFLAFEKFMQMRLPKEFWEEEFEHQESLQDFLNLLYKFFQSFELPLNFNSDLFQFKVMPFEDKRSGLFDLLPIGQLKFHPNAVMGIFPQSDSALLQDYAQIERQPELFDLDKLLRTQGQPKALSVPGEDQRFLVTAVDQSQEEVLMQVRAGTSVVVHGPPGTGKSQVILNLIADALAQGKRVLVCSQKRAALDVVYNRLEDLGLGQFAALVHDYRSDRNKIFAKIGAQVSKLESYRAEAADITQDKWQRDFRLDARRLDELDRYFDTLNTALGKLSRFGLSAHQLYLMTDADLPTFAIKEQAMRLDAPALRLLKEHFADLEGYLGLYDPSHPWRHRISMHAQGFSNKADWIARVNSLGTDLITLHDAWQPCIALGLQPSPAAELSEIGEIWKELAVKFDQDNVQADFVDFVSDGENISNSRKVLDRFARLSVQLSGFKYLDGFPLNLFEDLKERVQGYEHRLGKAGRFFSLAWLKGRWYVNQIIRKRGDGLTDASWRVFRKEFEALSGFYELWKSTSERRFLADIPILEGSDAVQAWCRQKDASLEAIKAAQAFKGPLPLHPKHTAAGFDQGAWAGAHRLSLALAAYLAAYAATLNRWKTWLQPQQIAVLLPGISNPDTVAASIEALSGSLARDFEHMRDHDQFIATWSDAEKQCLKLLTPMIEQLEPGPAFHGWLHQLENSVLLTWLQALEQENPELTETSSSRMAAMRAGYKDKVKARQDSAVALIKAQLQAHILAGEEFNRLGNPVTYREIARQVQKQRRIWPLRRLVTEMWEEGLARIMPCWLGSPESVAAIFPMQAGFFDLVVFDEASQCYVERALPVILRGKTTVVAGDDKQLQPFDLYNVKVEDQEAAFLENEMAMEVESALDLCKNVFPESKLMWHYRSRDEELIQFSNHAFYEGRLNVMPPPAPDHRFTPPIQFMRVDGRWENNRNPIEAKAVLDLLEELVDRPDKPSIGIVTFNHPQMELIREMLDERLGSLNLAFNPDLRAKLREAMAHGQGEERQGLFIKNIENVQGDERDIIIFSVGYARNAAGKLISNFGLLNQRGGGNRLNVAVTRARRKVYVACSFDPEELEVAQSVHEGPKLFKRYLQYARDVSAGIDHKVILQAKDPETVAPGLLPGRGLASRLAAMLRAKGLEVDEAVGGTAFKVDLAVRDGKDGYRLGIECEGPVYFSGRSSKEREVYRQRLLEANGWRMHRVWARAFFLDPAKVVQEILTLLGE